MELPAKLLDYFLRSNKSNINQTHTRLVFVSEFQLYVRYRVMRIVQIGECVQIGERIQIGECIQIGEYNQMGNPYLNNSHGDSGPSQWARGNCALKRSVAVRPDTPIPITHTHLIALRLKNPCCLDSTQRFLVAWVLLIFVWFAFLWGRTFLNSSSKRARVRKRVYTHTRMSIYAVRGYVFVPQNLCSL